MFDTPAPYAPILYAVLCDTYGVAYLQTDDIRTRLLDAMRLTDNAAQLVREGKAEWSAIAWSRASELTMHAYVDTMHTMYATLADGSATRSHWRLHEAVWQELAMAYVRWCDTVDIKPDLPYIPAASPRRPQPRQ